MGSNQWGAADWREYFEERVAVAMIDGDVGELEARKIAWSCCIDKWRDLNAVSSDPSRCANCGEEDEPGKIVPCGIGPYVWLHDQCWPAWDQKRRRAAATALRSLVT